MINHCDRVSLILVILDTSFVLVNLSSKILLHLECYLLPSNYKRHIKISKYIKQNKKYISITKMSDMSITVIYHAIPLTVQCAKHCLAVTVVNSQSI